MATAGDRDPRERRDAPARLARQPPPLLPLANPDRVRLGAALATLKAMPNPRLLEGQTAMDWTRRWMGDRAYTTVWEPLLRGKFGDAAPEIAMPWFWARVHDRSQALGYLAGGFQQLYERMADAVRAAGGETRFGAAVASVKTAEGGLDVETDQGTERFDRVVSTFAVRLTARLVPELPPEWREKHEWGRAYGAHCVVLALDRPLTSVYWLNVNDPGYPFMALVEHTNYRAASEYGGRHLVYLGNYRPMDSPLMTASLDDILDEFLPSLARLNPDVRPILADRCLGLRRSLRPADRDRRLSRPHPAVRHAGAGSVDRLDVPGLPPRPRPELLHLPRGAARGAPHRRLIQLVEGSSPDAAAACGSLNRLKLRKRELHRRAHLTWLGPHWSAGIAHAAPFR